MRTSRIFAAGLAIVAGLTVFAGCSNGSSPAAPSDDPVLVEGQHVFSQNCASCHGASGGGAFGPKLAGVVATKYPNIDDQIAVITNGRNQMPAFGQKLSAAQIDAVAHYTREVLGSK
jgi:mono/diheme cytochrome c family protein